MESLTNYQFAEKSYGRGGASCKVISNYASLKIKSNIIYHYTIEINIQDNVKNDDDKNRNQLNKIKYQKRMINKSNFEIFKRLVEENRNLFKSEPAFDCKQNVYSPTKIKFDGNRLELQVRFKLPEKKYLKIFNVVLIRQNEINLDRLSNNDVRFAERELQALDIIINYGSKHFNLVLNSNIFAKYTNLLELGRERKENINFEIGNLKYGRFGHHSIAKLTENGLKLCLDRVASVFNKGGSIIRIIEEYCADFRGLNNQNNFRGSNDQNNFSRSNTRESFRDKYRGGLKGDNRNGFRRNENRNNDQNKRIRINNNFNLKSREIEGLNEELKGLDFEVNHLRRRPRYTIYKLTEKPVSEIKFRLRNKENNREEEILVKTYFERVYKEYCLRVLANNGGQFFSNLPCVQVGKTNPRYFPLEVVEICQDQYFRKKLNSNQQALMTRKCGSQKPNERFRDNTDQLRNLIECSSRCNTDFLRSFKISIETEFKAINARILDIPGLLGVREFKPRDDTQWKVYNDAGGFRIKFDSSDFKWGVININVDLSNKEYQDLIGNLVQSSRQNNLDFGPPNFEYDRNNNDEVKKKDIKSLIKNAKSVKRAKFILFLIPSDSKELYEKIKFISECKEGIVTQCISQGKRNQFNSPAYCGNIVLKINSKLGGVNILLNENSRKVGFLKGKTMIMGFNVITSRGDKNQISISNVVATYDSKKVNYYSRSLIQESGHYEIVELKTIIKELFNKFHNRKGNGFYPEKVVVFRDGVNDGQFRDVMSSEIDSMKKAFRELEVESTSICRPKVTYIICQKGHNTRFVPASSTDALKSGNVKSGIIIDREIVSRFNEFYLCSHSGALGTSKPTRYVVLYDESRFTGDEIQQATYNLSFLFPRCSKAVSIVPPILYAQLVSKRTVFYISNLDKENENVKNYDELTEKERIEINSQIRVRENLEEKMYFL